MHLRASIPIALVAFLCGLALAAEPLLTVLRREGFTEFAKLLEGPSGEAVRNACPRPMILYAPTNAAIERSQSCSLSRREDVVDQSVYGCPQDQAQPGPLVLGRRATITTNPGALALGNLLNDPQFVNLGPGRNSSVVQKNVPNAGLGVVFSGLGDSVKVTGRDIPYECGVIRPVSGVFTLPRPLSNTLPFLGTDKTLEALQTTGLLAEFNDRPGITFLVPDDTVFPDLPVDQLAQLLRRHLLVGPPAYTPILVDGARYTTLAGTTVTVSVRGPDFFIGGARILAGDAIIKNGVIHTVDRLIGDGDTSPGPGTPSGTSQSSATAAVPTSSAVVTGGAVRPGSFVPGVFGMGVAAAVGYLL